MHPGFPVLHGDGDAALVGQGRGADLPEGIQQLLLAEAPHGPFHLLQRPVLPDGQPVRLRAPVVAGNPHGLFHAAVMVEQIVFPFQADNRVVIVAPEAEKFPLVWKQLAGISPGPHRILRRHILNGAAGQPQGVTVRLPVGAVGIDILSADLIQPRILKKPGHIQRHRIPVQAHHIRAQPDDPPGARRLLLSLWHAAAEGQIAGAVVIHHHRRIEQPGHVRAVRRAARDQQMPQFVPPGTDRGVRRQHADAVAAVAEIEKELFLPVDGLMGGARRPGINRSPGDAAGTRYGNASMVRPVHQVIRGNAVDMPDLAVAVFLHVALRVPLDDIVRHENIQPALIFHDAGIRTEALRIQGIVLPDFLPGFRQGDIPLIQSFPYPFRPRGLRRAHQDGSRQQRRQAALSLSSFHLPISASRSVYMFISGGFLISIPSVRAKNNAV